MASPPLPSPPQSLILTHPTLLEIQQTHHLSASEWAGPLTAPQYYENEHQLATHLSITHWILTTASPPHERPILASCETIAKRCLYKTQGGQLEEGVVHAVAAVFCEPAFRRRGYAGRMLRELQDVLKMGGLGSVLWSDIGPKYYSKLGWKAFPSSHVQLPAQKLYQSSSVTVRDLYAENLAVLCRDDEAILRTFMESDSNEAWSFAIVPNHKTMVWHQMKEEYICEKIFGKSPDVMGAIAEELGERVWAIWTRGISGAVDDLEAGNRLYILRLVVEGPDSNNAARQVEGLKAILEAAQNEASKWKLPFVEMWNPETKLREMIELTGIECQFVERKTEGIPSLMWFGNELRSERIQWVASERFAWC